jgi:flavin reductase (DIM6/NTAB) family NADH-FMN oxidoreductase RutF/DNA-binding IclR family transcriptional regulator
MRSSELPPIDAELRDPSNPNWFRQVLAQYPTGVCVVTAQLPEQAPVGMSVGSFTSVSLDPPLVSFFPHRGSTTWPKIRSAGRFCVNILGADQEPLCRRFARRATDRFAGLAIRPSALGSPIIEESVAWIDCELYSEQEAGDHYIVIGRVRDLQIESGGLPLLFFQGGYGRFSPMSLTAADPLGTISEQLRNADMARPEMERIAAELDVMCVALARVEDGVVVAASAGRAHRHSVATLVGQRLPAGPPFGSLFMAWAPRAAAERWLSDVALPSRSALRDCLARVRARGYQLGLGGAERASAASGQQRESGHEVDLREMLSHLTYDPAGGDPTDAARVRLVSVPVFGRNADVILELALYELAPALDAAALRACIDRALEGARRVTQRIGLARTV